MTVGDLIEYGIAAIILILAALLLFCLVTIVLTAIWSFFRSKGGQR